MAALTRRRWSTAKGANLRSVTFGKSSSLNVDYRAFALKYTRVDESRVTGERTGVPGDRM